MNEAPATIEELVAVVRETPQLLAVGAKTKPRLSSADVPVVSTRRLSGITEYDPSEFTFTALAGTPLREISATLGERGQYLPFDPYFSERGASVGGTVASGLSGPGRFRYGGIRDFILGVRFIDGAGRLLRLGGKVVKNAAGFDLPKFLVGSLGRFGVLAEITFKVFPRPATFQTLRIPVPDLASMTSLIIEGSRSRWELDAIEASPADGAVFLRLGGPAEANDALAREIFARWPGEVVIDPAPLWAALAEFRWADPYDVLVKVPTTPKRLAALCSLAGSRTHISVGGNVVYIALPASGVPALEALLCAAHATGLTLRGSAPLRLGAVSTSPIEQRIKAVIDPNQRFPNL